LLSLPVWCHPLLACWLGLSSQCQANGRFERLSQTVAHALFPRRVGKNARTRLAFCNASTGGREGGGCIRSKTRCVPAPHPHSSTQGGRAAESHTHIHTHTGREERRGKRWRGGAGKTKRTIQTHQQNRTCKRRRCFTGRSPRVLPPPSFHPCPPSHPLPTLPPFPHKHTA